MYNPFYYCYVFEDDNRQIFIYAISEKSARKKFKKLFGKEAGELLERQTF